eukprot:1583682-Alexandrium_andersonii.AAC.1
MEANPRRAELLAAVLGPRATSLSALGARALARPRRGWARREVCPRGPWPRGTAPRRAQFSPSP